MASISPTFSIITPAFNAVAYLLPLIQSISELAAHCTLEWIVIDDGSTDETAQFVVANTPKSIALTLLTQSNMGLAKTRNRGLAVAKGDYMWFVDADDVLVPDAMPKLLDAITSKADMIGFQAERFGEDMASETIYRCPKPTSPLKGETWLATLIVQKEWRHFAWLYLYRRQFLQDAMMTFCDGILHEDIAFTTEAALRAGIVTYADVCAYRYRLNAQSITGSVDAAKLQSRIDSYFVIVEKLRTINRGTTMSSFTRGLLQGEVVGQALQIFEIAKTLPSQTQYSDVMAKCRHKRLAQSLFAEARTFKRRRQVVEMWLKQSGWIGRQR